MAEAGQERKDARSAERVLRDLLEQSALLGAFDPLNLVPTGLPADVRAEVLTRLGRACDERVTGGEPRWMLKAEERRRVIEGLSGMAAARRIASRAPAPEDAFGRALQSALTGRDSAAPPEADALDAAYVARTFAATAPYAKKRRSADPRPVRLRIATEQGDKRRQVALPGALFGRDAERGKIEYFLRARRPAAGAFLVTGVGGIGKSALITAILNDALGDDRAPPVIVLDLDRPNLFRCDRLEIVREITRQLGRQRPRLAGKLAAAREKFGEVESETDHSAHAIRQSLALMALRGALPATLGPCAIVVDTFEEAVARGPGAVRDVLDWLETLRLSGGMSGMRLLVSGRSVPDLPPVEMRRRFAVMLDLGGLAPDDGAALLREDAKGRELFDLDRARTAAEVLQGHPQALRLLRRYAEDHPEEIGKIVHDGVKAGAFGVRFAQVFLYTRILNRIRDPEVARLAHPGLVLRRVTPELIRDVLAGPCGFGAIDTARAGELFRKLADTVWVVDRTDRSDVVVHRRELRRLMLPAMMNPDATEGQGTLREKGLEIHKTAAAWYGARNDTTSSVEAQEAEAFYHRASVDPDAVTPDEVGRFATALGQDLTDLPPRIQAIVRVVGGRGDLVSEEEFQLLPEELQVVAQELSEIEGLKRGFTRSVRRSGVASLEEERGAADGRKPLASDRFTEGETTGGPARSRPTEAPPTSFAEAEGRFGHEILAFWIEGNLRSVIEVSEHAYGRLWEEGSREAAIESREDLVYSAVWKSLMARSITGDWPTALSGGDALNRFKRLYPSGLLGDNTSGLVAPEVLHLAAIACVCNSVGDAAELRDAFREYLRAHSWPLRALQQGLHRPFALRLAKLATIGWASSRTPDGLRVPVLRGLLRQLTLPYARLYLDDDPPTAVVSGSWDDISTGASRAVARVVRREIGASASVPMTVLNRLLEDRGATVFDGSQFVTVPGEADGRFEARLVEIFDPVAGALEPLAGTPAALARLAGLGDRAAIWPLELRPDAIAAAPLPDPRLALVQLVDMADQCGLLGALTAHAAALAPDDVRIATAARLTSRIEEMFQQGSRAVA